MLHRLSMRSLRYLAISLLLATSGVPAQDGICPTTPQLGDNPSQKFWLHGALDHKPVRMYIERGGDVVVAAFYYTHSDWTPVLMAGKWQNQTILMSVQPEDPFATRTASNSNAAGRFQAKLSKAGFTGFWTPANARASVPTHLAVEPAPRCDGTGPLKRFDDPGWPITFTYPASWHLDDAGVDDHLSFRLICPNPAPMFYDGTVVIEQGSLTDQGSLEHLESLGYHRSDGKWTHNFLAGDEVDAKGEQQYGMTIVNGDGDEWRTYCRGGGYVGEGDGHRRLLIVGNQWVEISGELEYADAVLRIVASSRRRSAK
jgi:hypothetical protein